MFSASYSTDLTHFKIQHNITSTHTHTQFSFLLCSSGLVASPQVVNVDDESSFIHADHVPDFALINPLVLLQKRNKRLTFVRV